MALDGGHDFFHAQPEFLRRCLYDANVRLMRNQPIDIGRLQMIGGERFLGHFTERFHRKLEHRAAIHLQQRPAAYLAAAHRPRHRQDVGIAAVGVQMAGHDSRGFVLLQHHRAGAVAEKHAGRAIIPVENARIDFRRHHQRVSVLSRTHEFVGGAESIDEAAAYCLNIERRAAFRAELRLQHARGAREHHVRRSGRDHDETDVLRADAGRLDCLAAGRKREIARVFGVRSDMALANSGARENPLVGGIHHALEVLVGEDFARQVAAGAHDAGVDRHAALC